MIRALLLIGLLGCAGWTGCQVRGPNPERAPTGPVVITCDAICTASCLPRHWPQWAGDPEDPRTWDRIGGDVIEPLRAIAEHCDAAKATCVACIRRAERVGAICGATRPCTE